MDIHEGGCLCGAVRYETRGDPSRTTICHCRFCQRATGGPYMVEPIFQRDQLRVTAGAPAVYPHRSGGSGKRVDVHFCAACGTKLYLTFERFPGACGLYAGTFDEPGWFPVTPKTARHIFIDYARPDTMLPAGFACYPEHAIRLDGSPCEATVFDRAVTAGWAGQAMHAGDGARSGTP